MSGTPEQLPDFAVWYEELEELARTHGESVSDMDAWWESFDDGESVTESFYTEYPEHKDE